MIIDNTNGRLDEIKTFAKENNMLESFNDTFSRLETYSDLSGLQHFGFISSTVEIELSVSSNEPENGTGDGDTSPDWEIVDNNHVRLRAERAGSGDGRIYTVTITATDECGNTSSESIPIVVAHNITGPVSGKSFKIGSTVNFTGTFWDKPENSHTAKWIIDDKTAVNGVVTPPRGMANGTVTGSYKFNSTGVYKVRMDITDQNGVTTYSTMNGDIEEIVVIYDPNGGYSFGGGWYYSDRGALVSNPEYEGKVSFGFNASYFKTATRPKGETQFEFKAGEINVEDQNFNVLVYPNPAKELFTVLVQGSKTDQRVQLDVLDINGKLIETMIKYPGDEFSIGEKYVPGSYILRSIQDDNYQQHKHIKLR